MLKYVVLKTVQIFLQKNAMTMSQTQEDGTKQCILLEGNCLIKECQDLTNCKEFPTIDERDDLKKCVNTNEGCQLKKVRN